MNISTRPIFISGIGTEVGKTIVSAIISEALEADYWKPIQSGLDTKTDLATVNDLITNKKSIIHQPAYTLQLPASPHIAAKKEGIRMNVVELARKRPTTNNTLLIEGCGGILVPINEFEFMEDLILALGARVILVSKNYLGSINHSLLTAELCRRRGIDVIGWVFNSSFMDYEQDIASWSGYPRLYSVPEAETLDKGFIAHHAAALKPILHSALK